MSDLQSFIDLEAIDRELAYQSTHRLEMLFRDEGPLRRELYAKHQRFFASGGRHDPMPECTAGCTGARHRERCFMAGNRTGKTVAGAYESTLHATGLYPSWWTGKRFPGLTKGWACGTTSQKTAEIVQTELFGVLEPEKAQGRQVGLGTGTIPRHLIDHVQFNPHSPGSILKGWIRHRTGGRSVIVFKSYEAGREAFQGTAQDWIWLDEECPLSVYGECLVRTMTTKGTMYLTFTPLQGLSEVVLQFMPESIPDEGDAPAKPRLDASPKFLVQANWDDVPHLTEQSKADLWASTPPYQREARKMGKPALGAGAIYPVPESFYVVDDFPIPSHWRRVFGLDVGWNRTAAVWAAIDDDTDITYLWAEHYQGRQEPAIHVASIVAKGGWIPGVIDPAADAANQVDGRRLLQLYRELGLELTPAKNEVAAGIDAVWGMLSGGRMKVFASLRNWLAEVRLYRRDERGHIVKERDHLMDATRYLVMSGLTRACTQPAEKSPYPHRFATGHGGWMAS